MQQQQPNESGSGGKGNDNGGTNSSGNGGGNAGGNGKEVGSGDRYKDFLAALKTKNTLIEQMVALKILYEIIQKEQEKQKAIQFLKENNVFYKVIHNEVHEQIISRSVDLLKFMMTNQIIGSPQILYIWNLAPHSDARGRTAIEKLIGDISVNFKMQDNAHIIEKILQTELTSQKIQLLRVLKDRNLNAQYQQKIINFLWKCITQKSISMNFKANIEEEISKVFKDTYSTLKDYKIKIYYLEKMVERLKTESTLKNEIYIMRDMIDSFGFKQREQYTQQQLSQKGNLMNVEEVTKYLVDKLEIYQTLLKVLTQTKNKYRQEDILNFIKYLFEKDKGDVSIVIKKIYEFLGPEDIFLLWAKFLTGRAPEVFKEMLNKTEGFNKFQKLTTEGFEAIQNIIEEVNLREKNIRIYRKTISSAVQGGSSTSNTQTTPTGDYSVYPPMATGQAYGPSPKDEVRKFIYVLKSPFECNGISFLFDLLLNVKSGIVYGQIGKMIINFVVNLDESLHSKTQQFRQQFLTKIVLNLDEIVTKDEFGDEIKLKLQTYLNLIMEIFNETEKQGIPGITPHFTTIQGDFLKLKIQNQIPGNNFSKHQQFILTINESSSFWTLKSKIAQIYNEDVDKFQVIKYVNAIDESNFGKSLNDLNFCPDETIKLNKRYNKQVPRHQLLSEDNSELSPKMSQIVENWFNQYSSDGILGIDELKKLAADNWKGTLFKDEAKLKAIIKKHDKNQKSCLIIDEFKDFFITKATENLGGIWRLLNLAGYRNNLKYKDDPEPVMNPESFPRKILSTKIFFDTIFKFLENEKFQPLHMSFYKLLTMLETNESFFDQIKGKFKEFLSNEKCIYKLSYSLQAIFSKLKNNYQFYVDFYNSKAHQEISLKLEQYFSIDKKYEGDFITTIVLATLVKILSAYIFPSLPSLKIIRFIFEQKITLTELQDIDRKYPAIQENQEQQVTKRRIALTSGQKIDYLHYYKLIEKIFNNIVASYDEKFPFKLLVEIIRLYGMMSVVHPNLEVKKFMDNIKSQSLNIRRGSQSIIYLYLKEKPEKSKQILEEMIDCMPTDFKCNPANYYHLLFVIIGKDLGQSESSEELYFKVAEMLLKRIFQSTDDKRTTNLTNHHLLGQFRNLNIILEKRPQVCKRLIPYKKDLIEKCLFFYNAKQKIEKLEILPELLLHESQPHLFEEYVKCKTEDNRKVLMETIYLLHKEDKEDYQNFFQKYILPVMDELGEVTKKISTKTLNVGLNNLGSTCYMSVMIQTLNMIQPFRNGIMMINSDSKIVKELQTMLSFLFFSERIDFVPVDLLNSFVPPIDPRIQQDTTQFLSFLFDQIEPSLKQSSMKHLLEGLFKGNQVVQMKCHSCGEKRERYEQFYTYNVQIQGKYTLGDALQGMYSGQLIGDCFCESCGNRSDTTKRSVLNNIPNIFFVHLKRIVFNYDVFMNTKIHNRLYFPQELNIEPFTKEGVELRESLGVQYMKKLGEDENELKKFEEQTLHDKEKDFYKLTLKGIIVHSGSADVGHYIAILKKNNGWIKFDDSRITLFPNSGFEQQCYGGNWVSEEWGGSGSSKNAYVLVYERQKKSDIIIQEVINNEPINKEIPYSQFKIFNTMDWYKKVWLDNHSLMLQTHLVGDGYSNDFLHFISKMLETNTQTKSIIQLISEIIYKISYHSGMVGNLLELFHKNQHLITPQIFIKYLKGNSQKTFNLLFHYSFKIRQFTGCYISRILITCYKMNIPQLRTEIFDYIRNFLMSLHVDVAKNWMRIDGYFMMIHHLLESSYEFQQLYKFFIDADLIAFFMDFVLEKSSPLNCFPKKHSVGTKSCPMNFYSGLNIIFFLLRNSYGLTGHNFEIPALQPDRLFHLSDNAVLCLSHMPFYEKMLREEQNYQVLGFILQRLSIMNPQFSLGISRVLLRCLNEITDTRNPMLGLTSCITKVLVIRDNFWRLRFEAILGKSTPYIFDKDKNVLSSLDEQKYVYASSLEDLFPIECLFNYAYLNRLRIPLAVLNILKAILECCSMEETAIYLLKQYAPSYIHLRYIDWVIPFIDNVVNFLNLNDKEKQDVQEKVTYCQKYYPDLMKMKEDMSAVIIGKIQSQTLVETIEDETKSIQINVYDVSTWGIESLPTGTGNVSVDTILQNGVLVKKYSKDSKVLKLFKGKPKGVKDMKFDDKQDTDLTSLFDTDDKPTNKDADKENKMEIEGETKKMDIEVQSGDNPQVNILKPQQMKEEVVENKEKIEQKVQEKMEENIQEKEIEVEEEDLENITLYQDYLRKMEIINKTETNKKVTINFTADPGSFNLPSSLSVISSNKSKEVIWYNKENSFGSWNKLEISLLVEQENDKKKDFYWFKLYGNVCPMFENVPKESNDNNKMEIQEKKEPFVAKNIDGKDDFMQAEISCTNCTLLNPISNSTCEACGQALH